MFIVEQFPASELDEWMTYFAVQHERVNPSKINPENISVENSQVCVMELLRSMANG